MRLAMLLAVLLLSACVVETTPVSGPPSDQPQAQLTRSAQNGIAEYERIAARIYPVAVRFCRQENPSADRDYCDFRFAVDTRDRSGPNAYQSIGKDGRPVITFNLPMLMTVRNQHELAFIIGHEAGHQIANHIVRASAQANLGAILLGGLVSAGGGTDTAISDAANLGGFLGARAYSKEHELQADVVGTYVAHFAGFDPLIGAQSFRRFTGGGGFLSTHPGSGQRLATVESTMARIQSGQPLRIR